MVLYVVFSAKKISNLVNDELNSVPLSHILTKFYWEYFFYSILYLPVHAKIGKTSTSRYSLH